MWERSLFKDSDLPRKWLILSALLHDLILMTIGALLVLLAPVERMEPRRPVNKGPVPTTTFCPGPQLRPPLLISRVMPEYPPTAGILLLEAKINIEGNVESVKVIRSFDVEFTQAAIHAMHQWKHRPAQLNCRPIPFYLTLMIHSCPR